MDELLKKYKIEEISKKTSISPLFLKRLRDGDFDKISRLKFNGFMKILQSEYPNVDFSSLQEEYNNYYTSDTSDTNLDNSNNEVNEKILDEVDEEKKSYKNYIIIFSLILLVVILGYFFISSSKKNINNDSSNLIPLNINHTMKIENNNSDEVLDDNFTKINDNVETYKNNKDDLNTTEINTIEEKEDVNKSKESKLLISNKEEIQKKYEVLQMSDVKDYNLSIIPFKKLWCKVYFLDENKSEEYLSSHPIYINNIRGRVFIKLGHGEVKIIDGSSILEPNSKKITRVIISKDEINITNKRVDYYR